MGLTLKIVLVVFGFFAFDRLLLFYERKYYAKYGKFMIPGTEQVDLELDPPEKK